MSLLEYYHNKGFASILVNFDVPDHILQERVTKSQRKTNVFRTASTFEDVLTRQQIESRKGGVTDPTEDEANYLFVIKNADDFETVICEIVEISKSLC